MKPLSPMARRLLIAAVFGGTFFFTASVFTPDRSGAEGLPGDANTGGDPTAITGIAGDPHEGLTPLGTLISTEYRVQIFATPRGARYSVYDASEALLAPLLTAEQVAEQFSDLPIPDMGDDGMVQMMRAEPSSIDDFR